MAGVLTIEELAARCHHYGDRAGRLFELAGQWSATAEGATTRLMLARLSTHWSTHVEWWSERLPSVDLAPATFDRLDRAEQRVTAALSALAAEGPTPLGLRGLHELVAQLQDDLTRWAQEHDPDVDAPTRRVLDLVLADLHRDLADLDTLADEP